LDYNAGLVGVLAYIVSKLAPADTSQFGKPPKTPTTIKISLSSISSDTASYIKDTISNLKLYNDDGSGKQLHAHVFDQNGVVISNPVCDSITWNFATNESAAANITAAPKGCSFTVPQVINNYSITYIKATYAYAGANKPPITATVNVNIETSVLPRSVSVSRHGYAITVKPQAVTFSAAEGREITGLSIYNIQGKRIFAKSGRHTDITWTGTARPRGMYLIKMTMSNGAVVQRNLMLK